MVSNFFVREIPPSSGLLSCPWQTLSMGTSSAIPGCRPTMMPPTRCLARPAGRVCANATRLLSTSAPLRASPSPDTSASGSAKKRKPLSKAQRDYLDSAVRDASTLLRKTCLVLTAFCLQLRVNQAGELAAVLIYKGQTPPLVNRYPHLRPLMTHMYDQEAAHLATFNELLHRHRVRPTALYPLWQVMATGLGWSTALMGREAAMACTEAVETEIGGHYNEQIRAILEMVAQWEAEGYDVSPEIRDLIGTLRRIRDEELEHLDHAVEHDAKKAEPHWLLTSAIRAGCRSAIWLSERV